jgi:adenylate kinase
MAPRLPELVGRAMIDPDFLADLQRTPEAILAQYELNDDERRTVLGALARLASAPKAERAQAFRTALIRRVAT